MRHFLKSAATAFLCLAASVTASAYDFEENGIYYNVLSEEEKTCEVTYEYYSDYDYHSDYEGEIVIPEHANGYSVTGIGYYAFSGCDHLTGIIIPDGVTRIENDAFAFCDRLTSITLPAGLKTIGYEAFFGCRNLADITLPGGVTTIGESAFGSCSSLTNITIPAGVTSIGDWAFGSCSSLTEMIVLPQSILKIRDEAFGNCVNLESVTSLNSEPPTFYNSNVFSGKTYATAALYVPAEAVERYKTDYDWKNFRNIQAIGPTGIGPTMTDGQQNVTVTADGIAVDGVAGPVEVYSVDGTLVARVNAAGGRTDIALPGHGVYIIKVGDRTVKVNR